MSVPTPKQFAGHRPAFSIFDEVLKDEKFVADLKELGREIRGENTPKPTARPRTERSAPVRNPAFREHEGLKALQRTLHTKNK
jgi:hypothetical protein